jgi:hypothetical protein
MQNAECKVQKAECRKTKGAATGKVPRPFDYLAYLNPES